jgi:aldose 1-epimerase
MEIPAIVTLQSGELRLAIAPSIGGAVVGFWHGSFPLMRETPDHALRNGLVRQTSCYPLIPYSNRIAHGRFTFEGMEHKLALNFDDHPHSIHGNAWLQPWRVAESTGTSCRLTFDHATTGEGAEAWPFEYRAEQTVRLDPTGAVIALSLTNADLRAMPAGFGLHPFFPRRPDTSLRFEVAGVFLNGANCLPRTHVAVPEEWNYTTLRALDRSGLDNCFSGWDGQAQIRSSDGGPILGIEADPIFRFLVVYVPDGRDFLAVEPVSHSNNAINLPGFSDNGLVVLKPGETISGRVKFHVGASAP